MNFVHSCSPSFIYSFVCSFIHSVSHSFIHSFIHLFIHSFMHACIHSFIHSVFCLFIRLCLSFIYSFFSDVFRTTYLQMLPTRCSQSRISTFVIYDIFEYLSFGQWFHQEKDLVLICFDYGYGACQRYCITTTLQYFSDLHVFPYVHVHVAGRFKHVSCALRLWHTIHFDYCDSFQLGSIHNLVRMYIPYINDLWFKGFTAIVMSMKSFRLHLLRHTSCTKNEQHD